MSEHEISKMIEELEAVESSLSADDIHFVDDISNKVGEGRGLTAVQLKCLRSLYQRVIGED